VEPDHEIVPLWVLGAIVLGLAAAAGSMVVLAVVSIGTVVYTLVHADRTPPPRR
jgi:hypothetical protein